MNDELEIGRWGEAWQRFMRDNYPTESAELMNTERWNELALDVEREALDMWELLRRQYAKANPCQHVQVEFFNLERLWFWGL